MRKYNVVCSSDKEPNVVCHPKGRGEWVAHATTKFTPPPHGTIWTLCGPCTSPSGPHETRQNSHVTWRVFYPHVRTQGRGDPQAHNWKPVCTSRTSTNAAFNSG